MTDVDVVGGKNASLGEMIGNLSSAGVDVPGGFATTAAAYRAFLATDGLEPVASGLDLPQVAAQLRGEDPLEVRLERLLLAANGPEGGRDNLALVAIEP